MTDGRTGDYLLPAKTVAIHDEHCVLTVMLDITERKQTEAELLAAIETVMQDTPWFGQKILEKRASLTRHATRTRRAGLVAQGLGDDEIATKIGVGRNTARNHVSAIYRTIGLRKQSALVV